MIGLPNTPAQQADGSLDSPLIGSVGLRQRVTHGAKNQRIMARDNYTCVYCGCDLLASLDALINSSIDHVVPRAAGGTHDTTNLVACCSACNRLKTNVPALTVGEGQVIVTRHRAILIPLLRHRIAELGFEFLRQAEPSFPAPLFVDAASVLAGQVDGIRQAVETINRFAEVMQGGAL